MPPWTALYRQLILAPANPVSSPSPIRSPTSSTRSWTPASPKGTTLGCLAHVRAPVVAAGRCRQRQSRRGWWNDVAPVPSSVAATPFPVTPQAFGDNVADLFELGFLVDGSGVITVLGETVVEAAAWSISTRPGSTRRSTACHFPDARRTCRMTGMTEAWGELTVREAFGEAARAFAELVRSIPPESWDGPGLGEWSVRDLVGHTSRALLTVGPTSSSRPRPRRGDTGRLLAASDAVDAAAVAARGREAGQALGADPGPRSMR